MLKLVNVCKTYKTKYFSQQALKDVNLEFRKNEFVAVFGPSGSGKTTLLNIVGGLDRYDSGDLIINGRSTKNFKDKNWDSYRNKSVGFVFQNYNLITHISVLANVEMSMTLRGVSASKRRAKALEVLEKVGLKDHARKRPNQLSGGQMQRVAIARALVNDPDIIMADEPTGALDTHTSVQIMDLIKDIAKDKLVIMVTHNLELAKDYATRIVEFKDGSVVSDTNPVNNEESEDKYQLKKTAMSFISALRLSFTNISTKKGRTFLTAFASSIGIIGIAIILSLSNGFNIQIDKFESQTLSNFPIMISQKAMSVDAEKIAQRRNENISNMSGKVEYVNTDEVYLYNPEDDRMLHTNKFTLEYVDYINKMDSKLVEGVSFTPTTGINLLNKKDDKVTVISKENVKLSVLPKNPKSTTLEFLKKNYNCLYGNYPVSKEELVIVVDEKNRIDKKLVESMGFDPEATAIKYSSLVGKEIKLVLNNDFYEKYGKIFTINNYLDSLYDSTNSVNLKIVGILRQDQNASFNILNEELFCTPELFDYVVEKNKESDIVKSQKDESYNVLTTEKFDLDTENGRLAKENILAYLGENNLPYMINIYPVDFAAKEKIVEYLDLYNLNKDEEDQITYTDLAATMTDLTKNIMDSITIVLIAFSAISLIVSSIMIGIITYISVLERTKEIGILRALGARKKDITRVFNAETFIIGVISGTLGITIARLLIIPINNLLLKLTELENVAQMNPLHAFMLIVVSLLLTLIGGFIPAKIASKKDPVEALRTE